MEDISIPNASAAITKKKSKLYKDSDSAAAVEKNANSSNSSTNNLEHSDKVTPIKVKRSFWKNLSHVFRFRGKRSEVPEFPNDTKVDVIPVTRLNAIFEEPKNSDDIDVEEIENIKKTLQNALDSEAKLLQSNIKPLSLNTNTSDTNSKELKIELHEKTNEILEYLSCDSSSSEDDDNEQKLIQKQNAINKEKELHKNDEDIPKFIISHQKSLIDTKKDSLDTIADETKKKSRKLVEEKSDTPKNVPSNQYSFEYSDTSEQSSEDVCESLKEDVTSANKTEDQSRDQENHDQQLDHSSKTIIQNLISKIDDADNAMHESLALATNFEKQYQIGMATMLDIKQQLHKLSSSILKLSKDSLDLAETEAIKESEIINEMMYVIKSNMSILNDYKIDAFQILEDLKHATNENGSKSVPALDSNSTGIKKDNEENAIKFATYFGQNSQIPIPLGMDYNTINKEPMNITSLTQMQATTSGTKAATIFDNYSIIKPSPSLVSLNEREIWNQKLNELTGVKVLPPLVENITRLSDQGIKEYRLDRFFKMVFDNTTVNCSVAYDPIFTGPSIGCSICLEPPKNIIDEKNKVVRKRKMMSLLHNKTIFEKYIREYETEESDKNKDVTDLLTEEEKKIKQKIEIIDEKLEKVEEEINTSLNAPVNSPSNTSYNASKNLSQVITSPSYLNENCFPENNLFSFASASVDIKDTIHILENTRRRLDKFLGFINEDNKEKNCLLLDSNQDPYILRNNSIEQLQNIAADYERPVFEDIEELPDEDENNSQRTIDELNPKNLDDLEQSTVEDLKNTVVRNVVEEVKMDDDIKQNAYKQIENDVQNLINELLLNVHELKQDCIDNGVEVDEDNLIQISEIQTDRIEIMNDINDILSNILTNVVTTCEENLQIFQQPNTSNIPDVVPEKYKTFSSLNQIENQPVTTKLDHVNPTSSVINNDSNSEEDIPKNLQNPQQPNTSKIPDIIPENCTSSFSFLQEFGQIENQQATIKLDYVPKTSSNNYNFIKENTFGDSLERTAGLLTSIYNEFCEYNPVSYLVARPASLNPEESINRDDDSSADIVEINDEEEEIDGAYGIEAAAAVTQIHSIENDDKCNFADFSNDSTNLASTTPIIDTNLVLFDDEEFDETLFWDICKQTQTQNSDSLVYVPRNMRQMNDAYRYDYSESVEQEIIDFQILPNPQTELEFAHNNDRNLNQLPFLNLDQFDEAALSSPLNSPSISTKAKLLHNFSSRCSNNSVETLKNNFTNSKQNLRHKIYENIETIKLPHITDSLKNIYCDSFDENKITNSSKNLEKIEENDEDNQPGTSYSQHDYMNSELHSSDYTELSNTNNNSFDNTSEKSDSDQFKTIVSKKFSQNTDNSESDNVRLDVINFGPGTSSFSECPRREKLLLERKFCKTNLPATVEQVPSFQETIEHRSTHINLPGTLMPVPGSAQHFNTEKIINIPQTITHDNIIQSTNFIQKNSKKLPVRKKIEPPTKITDELQNINAHAKETMEAMNQETLETIINPSINSLSMSGTLSIISTISENYNEVFPNTSKSKKVKQEENAENLMMPLSASKILQSKKESVTSSSNSVKVDDPNCISSADNVIDINRVLDSSNQENDTSISANEEITASIPINMTENVHSSLIDNDGQYILSSASDNTTTINDENINLSTFDKNPGKCFSDLLNDLQDFSRNTNNVNKSTARNSCSNTSSGVSNLFVDNPTKFKLSNYLQNTSVCHKSLEDIRNLECEDQFVSTEDLHRSDTKDSANSLLDSYLSCLDVINIDNIPEKDDNSTSDQFKQFNFGKRSSSELASSIAFKTRINFGQTSSYSFQEDYSRHKDLKAEKDDTIFNQTSDETNL